MSDFTILNFMGESESGKSLCTDWVVQNRGFVQVAYADVLKRFCMDVFAFDKEQLWGEPSSRNIFSMKTEEDWRGVPTRFTAALDGWVHDLGLAIEEQANFKLSMKSWLARCKEIKNGELSPRIALQLLGTDYGRTFKPTIWADFVFHKIVPEVRLGRLYTPVMGLLSRTATPPKGVVIPDGRFANEMWACSKAYGYNIKVVRIAHQEKENEAEKKGITGHLSEVEIRGIPYEHYDLVMELGEGTKHVYLALEHIFKERLWAPGAPSRVYRSHE